MSVMTDRNGGERRSAWDSERMYPVSLTLLEHQMILHLRMAGAGDARAAEVPGDGGDQASSGW